MPPPRPGMRVRVHGLQKKPEYNDRAGTVKGEVAGGRWCVLLDGEPENGEGARELSRKPENFAALADVASGPAPASFCSNLIARGDLPPLLVDQAWAPYPPARPTGVACFGGSRLGLDEDGNHGTVPPCNALFYLELAAPGEGETCIWSKLHSGGSGGRQPASRRGAGLVGLGGGLWLWGGRGANDVNDCRVWWFDGTSWSVLCQEEGQGAKSKTQGPKRGRENFVSAAIGDEVLVWGGIKASQQMVDSAVWSFNVRTCKWRMLHNGKGTRPEPTELAASFVIQDTLYIHGGQNTYNCAQGQFWAWKHGEQRWQQLPTHGDHPHSLTEAVGTTLPAVGDGGTGGKTLGVVFGGFFNSGHGGGFVETPQEISLVSEEDVLRVRGPRYAELVRRRDPRHWDADRGQIRPGTFDVYQKDLFVFDPETLRWWRAQENEHLAVAKCWALACNGRLYVGGGYGFTSNKSKAAAARGSRFCEPECIAAISKMSLSLCGAGLHDARRHTCLGLGRTPWSTAPPEADRPDFDIGFGHAHDRSFVICVFGTGGRDSGETQLFTDMYEGPLSAQGLAVLQQRHLVDWDVLQNAPGPPARAPSGNGARVSLGLMTHDASMLRGGMRCGVPAETLDRMCVTTFEHHVQYHADSARGPRPVARSLRDSVASWHGHMAQHVEWLTARCKQGAERNSRVLDTLCAGRDRTPGERIVVDVFTTQLVPPVWRRLCVPWKVYLSQFDQQILRPALGLHRQGHLSVFRVAKGDTRAPELRLSEMPRFGDIDPMPLCFGPTLPDFVCGAQNRNFRSPPEGAMGLTVDQMHVNVFYGGALCDSSKVRLSDLLCAEGDSLEWVHDLGQAHRYTLRLVQVVDNLHALQAPSVEHQDLAAGDSVRVLDGAGNALPNDCGSLEHMALIFNTLWRPDGGAGREEEQREDHQAGAPLADERGGAGRGEGEGEGGGTVPTGIDRTREGTIKEATVDLDAAQWWAEYDQLRAMALKQSESIVTLDYLSVYDPWCFDRGRCAAEVRAACRSSMSHRHSGIVLHEAKEAQASITLADGGHKMQQQAAEQKAKDADKGCHNCGSLVGLQRCKKCLKVRFCGQQCLLAGWPAHKADCKAFRAAAKAGTQGA